MRRDSLTVQVLNLQDLPAAPAIGEMVAGILKEKLHLEEKENFIATRKGILDPNTLSKEERVKLIREKSGIR